MRTEVYKKIMRVVLIAGILLVAYFYGFRLLTAETVATERRIEEAQQYYGKLLQKAANSEYYQAEIERMEQEFDTVLESYRTELSQEEDLLFLHKLEKNTGITVTQAQFLKETTVYDFKKSSMPSQYSIEESTGALKGISSTIIFYFSGSYDQLKRMLAYTEGYENYIVLSSMEADFNRESGLVEGKAVIRRYAVTGADRKPEEKALPAVKLGTDNIFGDVVVPETEPETGEEATEPASR